MAEIVELLWDDQNIAHVGRHKVTPLEVEQVVFGESAAFFDAGMPARPGRLLVLGSRNRGRDLAVLLDTPASGRSYPVSARPMTGKVKRLCRDARGG